MVFINDIVRIGLLNKDQIYFRILVRLLNLAPSAVMQLNGIITLSVLVLLQVRHQLLILLLFLVVVMVMWVLYSELIGREGCF